MNLKFSFSIRVIALSLIGVVLITSCTNLLGFNRRVYGSGNVAKENRDLQSFTGVILSEEGDLFIDEGGADEQHIRLSSSGEYDGESIICKNAYVKITSSGNATLNALEVLEADLSRSGNVYYVGNPKIVYKRHYW